MDRYQQLLALSGDCVKEIALDGTVAAVNDHGLMLLRAPARTAVVGHPWVDLWPMPGRALVAAAVDAAARGERTDFEASSPDFDGEPRDWRVRVCPLFDDGVQTGILAVSTDITARNRAVSAATFLQTALDARIEDTDQQMAATSQRLAGLVESLETTESRLLATNKAYQQLEVMHHEAATGRRFAMAAQQAAEMIAAQAQKGEAVGQLLAGVVHDLNNCLQAAVSAMDMIAASGELGERSARYMASAEISLRQGTEMCRRLIGFAREYPYKPEAVDLSEMVDGMLPLLAQAVGTKAELIIETGEATCCAFVDRNTIERALLNLVINARDACEPGDRICIATGRTSVTRDASSGLRAAGDYLTLTVSDTGAGMSEDVLSRVFDVYFTTKPVGEGSGLGLPQVHSAVTQAGGFVTVTSNPGEGARFELALPLVRS